MKKYFLTVTTSMFLLILGACNLNAIIFLKRSGPYFAGTASYDWYQVNDVGLHVSSENPEFKGRKYRPKNDFNGTAVLGYYLDQWRFELEAIFRQKRKNPNFTHGDFSVKDFGVVAKYAAMFNVYYDIPPFCVPWVGFYLGAGVGCAFREVVVHNQRMISKNTGAFSYQLMAGVYYDINPCWTVTFGYRLFGMTPPQNVKFNNIETNTDVLVRVRRSPLAQSLELGIRYSL